MNKKYYLVILAIVFFLWWTNKAKAETTPAVIPTPEPEPNLGWGSTNRIVQSGDTFYKIVSEFIPEEVPKTKDNILKLARQNAQANGFIWDKYDDKPSKDLRDPDTLKPGQKLVIYTWGSFNENNPQTGAIMPGQQINAFNTWDTL